MYDSHSILSEIQSNDRERKMKAFVKECEQEWLMLAAVNFEEELLTPELKAQLIHTVGITEVAEGLIRVNSADYTSMIHESEAEFDSQLKDGLIS